MNRSSGILGNIDGWLVFFYCFLVFFGWANIYSSSSTEESREIFNMSTYHGKQLLWMGICFGLDFFIMLFDIVGLVYPIPPLNPILGGIKPSLLQ